MGKYTNNLPEKIKTHLDKILTDTNLERNDESLEKLAQNWTLKNKMFEGQINNLNMIEIDTFKHNDERGMILLTYSGSIFSIGPKKTKRWAEYASIKLRNDVPEIIKIEDIQIPRDIDVDNKGEFNNCPIKHTSKILKIAVCPENVPLEEQENRISEATIFLTNGFIKLNKTIIYNERLVDHFNKKNMISYIAEKNGITKKLTKQIIDDYYMMVESGILLGERVPIGKIGKIHISLRPARKARIGRNPTTGEEITIGAKPAMFIPKFSFGKVTKDKVKRVETKSE